MQLGELARVQFGERLLEKCRVLQPGRIARVSAASGESCGTGMPARNRAVSLGGAEPAAGSRCRRGLRLADLFGDVERPLATARRKRDASSAAMTEERFFMGEEASFAGKISKGVSPASMVARPDNDSIGLRRKR